MRRFWLRATDRRRISEHREPLGGGLNGVQPDGLRRLGRVPLGVLGGWRLLVRTEQSPGACGGFPRWVRPGPDRAGREGLVRLSSDMTRGSVAGPVRGVEAPARGRSERCDAIPLRAFAQLSGLPVGNISG